MWTSMIIHVDSDVPRLGECDQCKRQSMSVTTPKNINLLDKLPSFGCSRMQCSRLSCVIGRCCLLSLIWRVMLGQGPLLSLYLGLESTVSIMALTQFTFISSSAMGGGGVCYDQSGWWTYSHAWRGEAVDLVISAFASQDMRILNTWKIIYWEASSPVS